MVMGGGSPPAPQTHTPTPRAGHQLSKDRLFSGPEDRWGDRPWVQQTVGWTAPSTLGICLGRGGLVHLPGKAERRWVGHSHQAAPFT